MIIVQKLGWALLHFLWQGTAIVIVYAMLRGLFSRSLSARGRYALACAALAAMTIAPALTFLLVPVSVVPAQIASWSVSAAESQRLLPGVVAVWLTGVLIFSIRLLGGWRFTARLRSTAHPAPAEWQQLLEQIAARVGAKQTARLLVSSMVDVPAVIGWLRPVILVPVEFLTGVPVEHIKALLAHEMAHIRRLDYLASMLQSIAEAVLFYHPAVWWISEQIRAERELCCDDLAIAAGADVLTYARALAELESRQPLRLKPALAASGGSLVNRIRRLIEPELSHSRANNLPGPGAVWAMMLLWMAGVGVSAVHASQTTLVSVKAPQPVLRLSPDPLPTVVSHARDTLLFDPFLSAQVAQPLTPTQTKTKEEALRKELETPYQKWLNEDVVYIITNEERNAFQQLSSDEERQQFMEQFWLRRDPTPATIENEFKEEHYRRIAYANQRFSANVPGWKNDRGRIYIMFGPPDEIDAHPSGGAYQRPAAEGGGQTTTFPFEDWRYRFIQGIGNDIVLEFVDSTMNGDYHMTMDPSEKDALKYVPGVGLTPAERLQQFARLQMAPQVNVVDPPGDATGKLPTYEILPMQVRVYYLRVTDSSVLANVAMQFEGGAKSTVNVFGRVTSMDRRPVTTFERPIEADAQKAAVYQQSIPLAPGMYRLDIRARDANSGKVTNYEVALDVPHFAAGAFASSSLILADRMERLPETSIGGGMFVIGDSKVRPRPGARFTSEEKLGVYLQVYNFGADAATKKPAGSIEYEIDKAGSNEKVMDLTEEVGSIPNASASQVTAEKLLPLKTLQPGTYTLKVTATDRVGNQTLQRQGNFSVSLPSNR